MATEKSKGIAQEILDNFKSEQTLLRRRTLVLELHEAYKTRRFKKPRAAAKRILKDRKRNTGLYNTQTKLANYLDQCFLPVESDLKPTSQNPYKSPLSEPVVTEKGL